MTDETVQDKALTALEMRRKAADHLFLAFSHLREVQIIGNGNKLSGDQKELDKFLLDTQKGIADQLENVGNVDAIILMIYGEDNNLYAPNFERVKKYIDGTIEGLS